MNIGEWSRIFGSRNLKVFHGTIAVISADNFGSLALGGFKESCTATKMCRHCMATKNDSCSQVNYSHTVCNISNTT